MANDNELESTSKNTEEERVNSEKELRDLQESELVHLEVEFENYKTLYPIE